MQRLYAYVTINAYPATAAGTFCEGDEMSEGAQREPDPNSGTARGLLDFLDYVIDKNYMVPATASALRTGVKKVLESVPDLDSIGVGDEEVDDLILRFRNRYRGTMKDRSVEEYQKRLRQSVEMYRKWLDGDKDWIPPARPRRAATKASGSKPTPKKADTAAASLLAEDEPATQRSGMISYPFPIRPGVQGKITLPEDLTRREAERIAAFISTLAFDDDLAANTEGRTFPRELPAISMSS